MISTLFARAPMCRSAGGGSTGHAASNTVSSMVVTAGPLLTFSASWNDTPIIGVRRVSGLRRTVEVIEHQDSSATGAMVMTKLPGDVSFEPLTLERQVTGDPTFVTLADRAAPPVPGTPHRGTLTIALHDQAGRLVLECALHQAWVSAYDVFAELDAHSEPVVERITVVYQSWHLEHSPVT
jgi:phage tail-like protein